jgi:hypothetical protein
VAPDVPRHFAQDYREACLVLGESPRASAALSRRCLQRLLREQAQVPPSDLDGEIETALRSELLPITLASALDTVRVLGKFLTNPLKSTSPGTILHAEPGEAQWLLTVLEALFQHYFGELGTGTVTPSGADTEPRQASTAAAEGAA